MQSQSYNQTSRIILAESNKISKIYLFYFKVTVEYFNNKYLV